MEELGARRPSAPDKRLEPGDLVSYYAVAKDRKETVQTDLFMVQVQPFERRFLQAQGGSGGGGGMADEQGAISERQREILLATWNLQRSDERGARTQQQLEDSAKMLSELQATLAQQARTLAQRTRARIVDEDERISTFVESLERAAGVMDPAVAHLNTSSCPKPCRSSSRRCSSCCAPNPRSAKCRSRCSRQRGRRRLAGGAQFHRDVRARNGCREEPVRERVAAVEANMQKEIDEMIRKLKELAERQEKLAQELSRICARRSSAGNRSSCGAKRRICGAGSRS